MVTIQNDDDIVVDYGLGHVHFERRATDDGHIEAASQFTSSALQGGIKLEVWESQGVIDKLRTLILMEDGGWDPYSATASTQSPSFDDPPTYSNAVLRG